MIRLALVDDEELFINGLREVLEKMSDIEVVNTYTDAVHFKESWTVMQQRPDIVLMDMNMPEINGTKLTEFVLKTSPEVKVIGLSSHYTRSLVFRMLELGASSYLPKNVSTKKLCHTIRRVKEEGFYFDEFRLKGLSSSELSTKSQHDVLFQNLTKREVEVLTLICAQYTTEEIAAELYISNRTVERHRGNLLEKTNAKNMVGLLLFALKHHLVEKQFV